MKRSWKTTAAGTGAILVAVGGALTAIGADKDVATAIATAIPAIFAGIGLLAARDNDKSSEQVGAKKDPSAN